MPFVILLVTLFSVSVVHAAEEPVIGFVKTLKGEVSILSGQRQVVRKTRSRKINDILAYEENKGLETEDGTLVETRVSEPVNARDAYVNAALRRKDVIKTGPEASVGITFLDNTVITLGPETELEINEYLYKPRKGEAGLSGRMVQGTLQYISGSIAKIKPESVKIETPAGTIGVRGTRFVVKVDE